MRKLWAYGDSYTAGHELGCGHDDEYISKWLYDRTGVSSVEVARQLYDGPDYHAKVSRPWYEHIKDSTRRDLSWAGLIAKRNGLELINRADPGCGIDWQVENLLRDNDPDVPKDYEHDCIDWDNDIVVFGVPPWKRWMLNDRTRFGTWNKAKTHPTASLFLMKHHSLIHYNISLLFTIQTLFPKMYIIDLGMNKPVEFETPINESLINYKNDYTINDIADEHLDARYPGYHPKEFVHELFADYIESEVLHEALRNNNIRES